MMRALVAPAFRLARIFNALWAQRAAPLQLLLAAWIGLAALGVWAQTKKEPPKEPLDLNTATVAELQKLPGIGPTTAKAIVRFREKSGPFRRVEDLLAVRGITKKRLEKLRRYVTVKPVKEANSQSRVRTTNDNGT